MTLTRDEMVEKLRSGTRVVEFTKSDGSKRKMTCTLDSTFIPEAHTPKNSDMKYSEGTIRVFDTENNGWRSFRVDSVKSFDGDV